MVHDALVLPVVLIVGVLGRKVTPTWAWPAVRWALFTTGVVAVVSRPYVASYGSGGANPTVLPRNYGAGVLVALAAVWAAAAVWAVVLRQRGRPTIQDPTVVVPFGRGSGGGRRRHSRDHRA